MLRYILPILLYLLPLFSKEIIVLFSENLYPYSVKTGAQYRGYSVDLIRKIFEDSEYSLKFKSINSIDKGVDIVYSKKADLIATCVSSDSRGEKVEFSDSYSNLNFHLVKRAEEKKIFSINDVSDTHLIGIKDGDYSYHYLSALEDSFRVAPITDLENALSLLDGKKIDLALGEWHVLNNALERTNLSESINIVPNIEFTKQLRIGVQNDREELKSFIDQRLNQLRYDNFIEELEYRWLDGKGDRDPLHQIFNYIVLVVLLITSIYLIQVIRKLKLNRGRINLFRSVLKTIPDYILEIDSSYRIIKDFSSSEHFYKTHKRLFSSTGNDIKDVFERDLYKKITDAVKKLKIRKLKDYTFEYIVGDTVFEEFRVATNSYETYFIIIKDRTEYLKTKLELEENQNRYKSIINNLPGSAFRIEKSNTSNRYLFLSEDILEITEYDHDYFINNTPKAYLKLLDPVESSNNPRSLIELPSSNNIKSNTFEYRIRTRSGKIKWIQERSRLVKKEGDTTIYDGIYFDITDKREAEMDSEESKSIYKTIIENSTEGIVVLEKRNILYANSAFRNITGYIEIKHKDINLSQLISQEYIEQVNTLLLRLALKPMNVKNLVVSMIHKSGEPLWVDLSFIPIKWQEKDSVMIFITDITQKKNDEKEITRVKEYQNYILNTISQGLITVDERGRVIHTNSMIHNLFNLKPEEIEKKLYFNVIKSLERLHRYFFEVVEDDKTFEFTKFQFDNIDDKFFTIKLYKLLDEQESGMVIQIEDVTEIEKKELQLIQAQKMETVGTLAGGLAHDFNNVLGGIVGTLSVMKFKLKKDGSLSKDVLEGYINTLEKSGQSSTEMVKQLLTLSRKQDISFAPVDLNKTVNHVIKILRSSIDKSVNITPMLSEKPAKVNADPVQIEQVILNLCVNAGHAMTIMKGDNNKWGGTLKIGIDRFFVDSYFAKENNTDITGNYISITIEDEGVGISNDNLAKIFDPFFTTKDKDKGTGLGLAMVYNIIKQHSGIIKIYSELSVGTTFKIFIPAYESEIELIESKREESIPTGTGTVLVVDDQEVIRVTSKSILEECGYTVMTGNNGEEAIEIFKQNRDKIDLIIIDLVMPILSGEEALKKIRAISPNQKVVLASGFKQDKRVQTILESGDIGYIQKPFTMEALANIVSEMLN